jgi:hypothetical protein
MADLTHGEIVLESANKQNQYMLFVTDDGRLATVRLFRNQDGSWKPKGADYKVLANIDFSGKAWTS